MNQLFYTTEIILSNFSFYKPAESRLTDMHFNGLIRSSACVQKIIEHAADVSKLLD